MDLKNFAENYFIIRGSVFKKTFMEETRANIERDAFYKDRFTTENKTTDQPNSNLIMDVLGAKFREIMVNHKEKQSFIPNDGNLYFRTEEGFKDVIKDVCKLFLINGTVNQNSIYNDYSSFYDCDIIVNKHSSMCPGTLNLSMSKSVSHLMEEIDIEAAANKNEDWSWLFGEDSDNNDLEETDRQLQSKLNENNEEEKNEPIAVNSSNEKKNKRTAEDMENTIADNQQIAKKKKKKKLQDKGENKKEENELEAYNQIIKKQIREATPEAEAKKKKKNDKGEKCTTHFPDNETVIEKGFRAEGCDADTLLEHIKAHTADYVKEGREIFEKNAPKIINSCKAVWSFTRLLEKLLSRLPFKLDPETKDIEIPCSGCALHCPQHYDLPLAPGRPPKDALLNLQEPSTSRS